MSNFPPSGTGSGDMKVLIGDMECDSLRKHASRFMGYKNFGPWTSPELFQINDKKARNRIDVENTPPRSNALNSSNPSDSH